MNIGNDAVVGARSLVKRDIPSGENWGVPYLFICTLGEFKSKHELHLKNCRKFDFNCQRGMSAEMKQEMMDVLMKDGTAYIE